MVATMEAMKVDLKAEPWDTGMVKMLVDHLVATMEAMRVDKKAEPWVDQ